jgi:hypothetical protein
VARVLRPEVAPGWLFRDRRSTILAMVEHPSSIPETATGADAEPSTDFQQIGTFVFRERVATTPVGAVYRGYDRADGQPVVIKVGDPRASELRLDASVLPRLAHPGIVPLRDAGLAPDGSPVIAHDAARAAPLTEAAARFREQYRQIAHFIREVALTLDHAHELGVTCGDLAPRNLYVSDDDLPLIGEMGMGLATAAGTRVAEIAREGRDPAEAVERKFKLDERADVFALGAILFYLLTGETPTDQPVARASDPHAPIDDVPPIDVAAREAPTELRAICAQALATDPVHRYLHAADVVRDLDSYLHGKRRRPMVKVGFVAVGALLVGLFGIWGTVGGGPARIVELEVLARRADVSTVEASLIRAERALGLDDRFAIRARLSKAARLSVFYRDPTGTIHTLPAAAGTAELAAEFVLPADFEADEAGWHPPPPGGVGLLVIVAHADGAFPQDAVAGVLAGMKHPPRSFTALALRGRSLPTTPDLETLPVDTDPRKRTRKSWPEYADQVIRGLAPRCDDVAVGLMYVMGV